jgi:predicted aminopeptidase
LPDNASYRRYADLKRGAAVWNVVAAPELSLTLKTWCFPVVGCIGYRGYFDRDAAEVFGTELRSQGLEVTVYGVPAYSTLGAIPGTFFADPLLSTFIHYPEGELARLVFHELSHQVAYAHGDTMFNESFATAVERIGGARWLKERASAQAREDYERFDARRRDFRALTRKYREQLDALYRGPLGDDAKRAAKAELMARLRAEYGAMKTTAWGGFSGYDGWFARANNASLGVLAAYNELVPAFERLFEREGRDFDRFYAQVKRLAAMPKDERRAALGPSGD